MRWVCLLLMLGAVITGTACGTEAKQTDEVAEVGGGGAGDGGTDPGGSGPRGAVLDCPPGHYLEGGACIPPGVPEDGCGQGFVWEADGCRPVLPTMPCPDGEMALPGETSCRKVSPCGTGTWGDIPVDASTIHVDASYTGALNDGTAQHPYTTITTAMGFAATGATIAIAAGSYDTDITINKSLTLWGRCPELVRMGGDTAFNGITISAPMVTVRGVRVEGEGYGIYSTTDDVVLRDVHVRPSDGLGVYANGGSLTVQNALIEDAVEGGIGGTNLELTVEDVEIRDVEAFATGELGRGIEVFGNGAPTNLTVRRVRIERVHNNGIWGRGATMLVEDSYVRDVSSNPMTLEGGAGLEASRNPSSDVRANLTIRRSVFEGLRFCGVCTYDSEMSMDASTVRDVESDGTGRRGYGVRVSHLATDRRPNADIRHSKTERTTLAGVIAVGAEVDLTGIVTFDTRTRPFDGFFGRGIEIEPSEATGTISLMRLRGARVERSREVGVYVLSSEAYIEAVHVLDTLPRELDGRFGAGMGYSKTIGDDRIATGTVSQVVVENAHSGGFGIAGATVTATDLVVRNTMPQASLMDFGDGVVASSSILFEPMPVPTTLVLQRATVEGNARAGVAAFGATIEIRDTEVSCNAIDLNGEEVLETPFTFDDRGNNQCGCGDEQATCRVVSSGLQPPTGL